MRDIHYELNVIDSNCHQHQVITPVTHLREQIAKEPTDQRGKSLHGNGVLIQRISISLKSRDGSTSGDEGVAEQGATFGGILLSEGGLIVCHETRLGKTLRLGDDGANAKGLHREAG